ncbi:ketopantoate reductase family protein [Pectinatus haikarae]|uniref:2-dehydropantoate 2-reductase n=1 Tax=Pectinatus haikarae TaxID=349096 RepID=A0ABT9Y831_9FIRM|nr:ketopantoate reductase family protein [Pectinatus haikarae]MDQ0203990.1 2-dehydropantoate 2-reductase [Pectinatus haikarae]
MKYVILGAGGTGACIGGFLAAAGKDVTFIARGRHLQAMNENGLIIHSDKKGEMHLKNIKAMSTEEYKSKADVVFVSVKGYSLDEVVPFLKKAADRHTIIIPILNIFGTGKVLAEKLPGKNVLEGCIYIVAWVSAPGEITQRSDIFRVVYGTRGETGLRVQLDKIAADLLTAGIAPVVSQNIAEDTYRKFTFVSPMAAVGAYYDVTAEAMQNNGEYRSEFSAAVSETLDVGRAMGLNLDSALLNKNLSIMDALTPETTASMQKDLKKGGKSEIDGLVFEVVRMAERFGVAVPCYTKIAKKFGFQN